MSRIVVVTDSAASLPPALARSYGIQVVALSVVIDGAVFDEDDQISAQEVLHALEAGKQVSTSKPSVATFEEAFAQAEASGATGIVAVLISSRLSGTVDSALAAAKAASVPVAVVDSRTVAMGTGYAAVAAAAYARAHPHSDVMDVAERAQSVADSVRCIFTVATLDHLRRGGRLSPAVATVGTVLGLRPVLEIIDGEAVAVERVRSTARARTTVLARIDDAVTGMANPAAAVMALGHGDYAERAALELEERHPHLAMMVRTPISAVLASHAGPGTLAAVIVDLPRDVS